MKKLTLLIITSAITLSLSACSKTQEQFDFSKKAPDEFAVITRAPLEMPSDYTLPPPRPGMERRQESSPETQAKTALFGDDIAQEQISTSSENILLQKSGAQQIDPNIRDIIDSETQELVKENTSTFNKILGKAGKKVDVPATIVDPIKENERIQANKAAGKSITEGETPSIEQ